MAGAPPDAGGAVEVEEAARPVAAGVLHDEVAVEHQRLHLGQRREVAVDVLPAALHDGDLRVDEVVDAALEDVGQRQEVGVEDQDELALGGLAARSRSAPALKPVRSTRWMYSMSSSGKRARQVGDLALADLLRLVGAVVEHLDLEAVARVADAGDGVEQPLDHVHLVEQRQLHGDRRQLGERPGGPRPPVAVPVVQRDQRRTVEPVERQHQQDGQVSPDDQTGNRHVGHYRARNCHRIVIRCVSLCAM